MVDIFDEVERRLNRPRRVFAKVVFGLIAIIGGAVVVLLAIQLLDPEAMVRLQARQDAAYDRAYEEAQRDARR